MSLFKTIDELKQYINIDVNSSFSTFLPYIKKAEATYIIPVIGQTLFDAIDGQYNASPTTLSPENTLLLPYIQRPLASYALLLSINELSVQVGDQGIRDSASSNMSMPAPKWKQEKLERQALLSADKSVDQLLKYLEDHADNVTYNSWFEDPALNTKMSGTIVYSTEIASKYIDILESRRTFLKLVRSIKDIENTIIKKAIGADQYNELVTELKAGTVTPQNRLLLDRLEPIIAKRALYVRIPFMNVAVTEGGLFTYSNTDDLRDFKFLPDEDQIDDIREELKFGDTGFESDEQQLKEFIFANINDYPLIKASTAYTSRPDPGPTYIPQNDSSNGFFSV